MGALRCEFMRAVPQVALSLSVDSLKHVFLRPALPCPCTVTIVIVVSIGLFDGRAPRYLEWTDQA